MTITDSGSVAEVIKGTARGEVKQSRTQYSVRGDYVHLLPTSKEGTSPKLPAGNYVIEVPEVGSWFLKRIEPFSLPSKVYGEIPQQSDRILTTFLDRPASTGVLLAGEKGSGKTLLAKVLSAKAAQDGIPTITINAPLHGDAFSTFIQSIDQPAVILFDEFEKVYPNNEDENGPGQKSILTLLDGVFPTKKLFVLTCNNQWRVDKNLINRPGRIYYFIEFDGVTEEFIAEYCADNLADQTHVPALQNLRRTLGSLNFDQLQAMVEEMNRWGEPPSVALKLLNVKTRDAVSRELIVESITQGKKKYEVDEDSTYLEGDPFSQRFRIYYFLTKKKDKTGRQDVDGNDLTGVSDGRFIYQTNGFTVVIKEKDQPRRRFNPIQLACGY